jgi:hypothetical protein
VRDAVNAWKRECAALCIQTTWRMYYANKNFYKVRLSPFFTLVFIVLDIRVNQGNMAHCAHCLNV